MKRSQRHLFTILFGIVAILAVVVFARPREAPSQAKERKDATPVRLAHFPNLTHAPALVAVAKGMLQKGLGERGKLEVKVVNAGPEAMEAMLAGELDLAYVGPSPAINTYIKTGGKDVRVVAGACAGGASLVARKDAAIRSLKDLAGKRVATPQLGNTQDVSLRRFIATVGLSPKERGGQVEILPIKNPDILTQFKLGQIDAAWVPEPWATRIVEESGAVRVLDERTLWPKGEFPTTVIVARTAFLEAHPDLVKAVVQANRDAIRWIAQSPDEAKKVVNDELKRLTGKALPGPVLDESWSFMTFTEDPMPNCFETFVKAATESGFLKDPPSTIQGLFAP